MLKGGKMENKEEEIGKGGFDAPGLRELGWKDSRDYWSDNNNNNSLYSGEIETEAVPSSI
jgi:hypothetical protein